MNKAHNSLFMLHASRKGFTMVEVLLYIAILAILLLAVGSSAQAFLEARIKNQSIAEVNNQGSIALNMILQTIRNATGISGLAAGASSNTLTLTVLDASKSPTVFKLESDASLSIKEGAGATVSLTDLNKVLISLEGSDTGIFTNLSRASTPGIIRVRFKADHKGSAQGARYYLDYTKNFQGGASLR